MKLTRFIPSVASAKPAAAAGEIENVRAVVRLGDDELIVATDANGVVCLGERDALPRRAQVQLAYHDVATSKRALELRAQELYIFDLQTIEMLPDAPGLNDPLYLYGLMYGPYPAKRDVVPVEGQLTVTRTDLLGALVHGVEMAFAYPPEAQGSRAVHALLPGEGADMIAIGRGVVLALPLAPAWLPECPLSNDLVVAQLLYDVLVALRAELRVEGALPVPNRAALEADLVAKGWRIEGDEAVKPRATGLLGALRSSEKKQLPRQATLDELVAEARTLLTKLPGVPTSEALALRALVGSFQRMPVMPVMPVTPVVKTPGAPTPVSLPPRSPTPRVAADRSDWVKDFVDAHRAPSRPPPRVTTPARVISKDATPAWMDDFAEPAEPADSAEDPAPKPDWSSDFE